MAVFAISIALCLLSAPVLGQRNCEPCVTVQGDPGDPLVGTYRCFSTSGLTTSSSAPVTTTTSSVTTHFTSYSPQPFFSF